MAKQQSKPIPEIIRENKAEVESVFLRTIIKRDSYNKLRDLAKSYATGQGHWDFGVAIQLLLENYENVQVQSQSEKMDLILQLMTQQDEEEEQPSDEIEMLGGHKIKK